MAIQAWKFVLATALLFTRSVTGHMEMSMPYPINSQLNPAVPSNLKDYSYTSPLDASGANFPCKGYQNDRPALITATYTAGQTSKMTFAGSATHGGGSCQISLSYDNGKTFRVIKSIIGGCPLPKQYEFTIPTYAPGGNALLSWTWYNLIGNREIYNDCAWITIHNTSTPATRRRNVNERRAAQQFTSFEQLPYIWKANLPDNNNCKTVEGQNPVFPNPGPDVEYGAGESSSSPPTAGSCESPSPPGAAYKDMAIPGGSGPPDSGSSGSSSSSGSGSGSSSVQQSTQIPTPSSSVSAPSSSQTSSVYNGGSGSGSGSSSSLAQAAIQTPTTTLTMVNPTTTPVSNGGSSSGTGSSGSSGSGSSGGSGSLAFASNPPDKSFYPCTPGSFLCTSSTTFLQCASTDWYVDMGSVAAGTQCQPQSGSGGARADVIVGS